MSNDSTKSYEVAGGAGDLGVGGVVSTNVIQNTITAAIEDASTTVDTKDLIVTAQVLKLL